MTSTASQRRTETALRIPGLCRHCGLRPGDGCRKLCRKCWLDRDIRDRYAPLRATGPQEKTATVREAKKLAACPAGSLPCMTCSNVVQVNPLLYARAMRVQCPWSICEDCKRSVGSVRDGAVGMRGEYDMGDDE